MASEYRGGFLRDTTTGALIVASDEINDAFTSYRLLFDRGGQVAGATTTPVRLLYPEGVITGSANAAGRAAFALAPTLHAVTGRTTKLYISAVVLTNATAPAVTITAGLYPLSAPAGTSGNVTVTVGTVVTGSTVAFATPAAQSVVTGNSGDFDIPAAGAYALGFALSGSSAAGSDFVLRTQLYMRQVTS